MDSKKSIIVGQAYPVAPDNLVGPIHAMAGRMGREVTFQHKQMWAGDNYIFQLFADYDFYQAGLDWAYNKLLDHTSEIVGGAIGSAGSTAFKWIRSLHRPVTPVADPLISKDLEDLYDGLQDALAPDKPHHEQMCDLSLGIPTNATGERDAGAVPIREPVDFLIGWIGLARVAKWMQICITDFLNEFGGHPAIGTARTSVSFRENGDTIGLVEVEVDTLRRTYTTSRSADAERTTILVEDFGTPPS